MIRHIFNRVQDEVESLDELINKTYEPFFKTHRAYRYSQFITCLTKPSTKPSSFSLLHSQCLKEIQTEDEDFKKIIEEINAQKIELYQCLNRGYIRSEDDNMDSESNKLVKKEVEQCLNKLKSEVLKTLLEMKKN